MTLYKYLKPERIDVIRNLELRFTQPGALNDPFELRPRFQSLINEAEMLANLAERPVDLGPLLRNAYDMLPEEHKARIPFELAAAFIGSYLGTSEARSIMAATIVALLQQMRESAQALRERLYDILNSNVGILSLSEVPDDVVMWAHYADNHRGMVLGFDGMNAFFNRRRSENDDFYYLRKVTYADLTPATSPCELDDDSFFVTKGKQWGYEREWRMLAPLKEASRVVTVAGDVVYLYSFPPGALNAVFVGAKADSSLEQSVVNAIRESNVAHVSVSRAKFDLENQRVQVEQAEGSGAC